MSLNLLSVEGLSKFFGERKLFSDLSFGLDQGQKMALVAKNGEGKTTLLELLAGNSSADSGTIVWRKDVKIAYLSQDFTFDDTTTLNDFFYDAKSGLAEVIQKYKKALEHSDDQENMQKALDRMDQTNAWDYQSKIEKLLEVFELPVKDWETKINTLSGGQIKRLALIQCLLQEPDVYILDEPTNHLDVKMISWLEEHLSASQTTVFMVTHDRYFLNAVCNQILELDLGEGHKYNGNYEYFLEKKAERLEALEAEIDRAKNTYRKEVEWIRRMPKARGTKSKSRIERFSEIEKKSKSRIREQQLDLAVKSERLGSKILEFHKLNKAFGDLTIVDQFSYVFKKGDKIGIAGKNGVGKTTFLNMIMGLEAPSSGKIIRGDTVRFGYYTQSGIKLKEDQRVIECVKSVAEIIPLEKGKKITAAQLLERFLFDRKQQYDYVSKLSGGEKKRLHLLMVLMANPNFLILDEPTNDLDIKSIQVLEEFLIDFPACLIIVSHDRSFMDRVANHIFHFKGAGVIKDYNGSFSQLLAMESTNSKNTQKANSPKEKEAKKSNYTDRLSYNEAREFSQLEKDIEALEVRKKQLNDDLNSTELDQIALFKCTEELGEVIHSIDEKTLRWMELAERAD